jgi:natural resistance-associated macrophage protein
MFYKAGVPMKEVAEGFVIPRLPRSNIGHAVALVGSLIMPHNIYLHSALVQSRQLRRQDDHHRQEALVYYGIESGLSLLVGGWECRGVMIGPAGAMQRAVGVHSFMCS